MTGKPKQPTTTQKPPLRRDQHSAFGKELRGLIGSAEPKDKEIAGIVIAETEALAAKKGAAQKHPKEKSLHGEDLRSVGCLKLYVKNNSIRVYYSIIDGVLWMLKLTSNKRRTNLTDGEKETLTKRLAEVRKTAHGKGRTQ